MKAGVTVCGGQGWAKHMFFKSKKVLGLDIGTSSLKLAELDVGRSGATLRSFRLAPTPLNSVSGGEIVDSLSLSQAIRGLAHELGSRRKSVCTGMWGMSVIVKKITMPKMEKNLLAEQIRYEAEQYIPFDINTVSLSHHLLRSSSNGETQDILLIAAQNELVAQYYQVLTMANLECKILDVSGFALANCFEMNYGRIPGETIGLLNFGAAITNFVAISNGDIIFSRDIPVGGSNYTNEISKGMGISFQEAEILKLSAMNRQEVPDDVMNLISSTNESIAEEIRNSFDFLGATTNGLAVNRCLVTGGSAGTLGLLEAVARSTQNHFEHFNPFLKIKVNSKGVPSEYRAQIAPLAAVAVGLGLRQMGDE